MARYEYRKHMKEDIKEYITNELPQGSLTGDLEKDSEKLYELLCDCDDVTGNGCGSYTLSRAEAKSNIEAGNVDLMIDAMENYGISPADVQDDWERMDVLIRCYLLDEVIATVVIELEG